MRFVRKQQNSVNQLSFNKKKIGKLGGWGRVQNAVLGCSLKKDRMISVPFQGKSFNITVIQVYATTNNTEKAEVNGPMKTYKTF